jgi:hypothetical protein
MSRYYGMNVTISGHKPECAKAIREAAAEEWPFEEWSDFDEHLSAYGEDNLCGGETEEQFTERLTLAIWQANDAYCEVSVDATYLESLPYETHSLNEADYERLVNPSSSEEGQTLQQQ